MSLQRPLAPNPYDYLPEVDTFTVSSDDVTQAQPLKGDQIQADGDRSPHLSWSGAPAGTKSYVVTCFDADAPTPSGFWHWALVDIPAHVTSLESGISEDTVPAGSFHLRNDGGSVGYMGAAPPAGDRPHRYFFVVHAVGEESLGIDADASNAVMSFNLAFTTLGRAVLHGTHQA